MVSRCKLLSVVALQESVANVLSKMNYPKEMAFVPPMKVTAVCEEGT